MTKRPVGLMWLLGVLVEQLRRNDRLDDILSGCGAQLVVPTFSACWVEMTTHPRARLVVRVVLTETWLLPFGPQVGHHAVLAHLGQAVGSAVRSEMGDGISSGVSLVA